MKKLGFIILSHREPDQVFEKLLARINQLPNVAIALHHDFSQSQLPDGFVEKYNIQLVQPTVKTQWGHISKVYATYNTFLTLYDSPEPPDWYITISPNCYFIKSVNHIVDFFERAQYDCYIEAYPLSINGESIYGWHYKTLFTRYLFSIPFLSRKGSFYWRALRWPIDVQNTPFKNMQPCTGSDWFMLNHRTMKRIVESNVIKSSILPYMAKRNEAKDMNASPDEIFFHTIINQMSGIVNAKCNYRYINWEHTTEWHPNSLTMKYFDEIRNSDALFARKFSELESMEIIKKIDLEILDI